MLGPSRLWESPRVAVARAANPRQFGTRRSSGESEAAARKKMTTAQVASRTVARASTL